MFHIRRMGINSVEASDYRTDRPLGYDCYLLLYIKTKAIFEIDDKCILTEPKTFMLYRPSTPHYCGAAGVPFVNDWMHLETTAPIQIMTDTPVYIGDALDMDSYLKLICEAYYRHNTHSYEFLLNAMFHEIKHMTGSSFSGTAHSGKLLELRQEIYRNPAHSWSIGEMADRIHVSSPYIQELYKKAFHISCMDDVIASRISMAKMLLSDTGLSVEEVGIQCGYNSPVHFSRQFWNETGLSPKQWRESNAKILQNVKNGIE